MIHTTDCKFLLSWFLFLFFLQINIILGKFSILIFFYIYLNNSAMRTLINIFMNIFDSLNRTTNLKINLSFKVMYKIKIIKNYLKVSHCEFLILILRMRNFIDRTIITLLIK